MRAYPPFRGKSEILDDLWQQVHLASKDDFRKGNTIPITFGDAAEILEYIEKLEEKIDINNPNGSIGKLFTTPVEFKK